MPNILSMSFISSSFTSITSSSHSVSHFHPPSPLGFFFFLLLVCAAHLISLDTLPQSFFPLLVIAIFKQKKEIIFSVFFFFAFPLDLSVQLQTNSYEIYLHATVTLKHQKTKERPSSNEMTWTVGVCVCTLAGIAAVSVICRKNHHPAWLCSYYFLFVWLLLTRLNFLSLFSIPKPCSTRLFSFLLSHSAEKQSSTTRGKADCVQYGVRFK